MAILWIKMSTVPVVPCGRCIMHVGKAGLVHAGMGVQVSHR